MNMINEDLNQILNNDLVNWNAFKNSTVLITGGTGLVGSYVVKNLIAANKNLNLNIRILLVARNPLKVADTFGEDFDDYGINVINADIREKIETEENVDYIIHCAAVTTSRLMVEQPVELIDIAYQGTRNILELAKEKKSKGVVYISSMEVYGATTEQMNPISEKKLGYVDLDNVRSGYPEGKRICELLCTAYAKEYGVPVKSARLAQTFGAGVSKSEGRVFAQFAKSAMSGQDIVLHTPGEAVGNYCYLADTVEAIFCIMQKGVNGEAYNVSNNEASFKIKEMAQMVADEIAGGKIKVVFDIPEDNRFGYADPTCMRLTSDKLQALGWKPRYGLKEMYQRMIESWRQA